MFLRPLGAQLVRTGPFLHQQTTGVACDQALFRSMGVVSQDLSHSLLDGLV